MVRRNRGNETSLPEVGDERGLYLGGVVALAPAAVGANVVGGVVLWHQGHDGIDLVWAHLHPTRQPTWS